MKKQNKLAITAVIALAIVVVSVAATYAFITFVIEGTKTNVIEGGSLVLSIDESANGSGDIELSNAFPVSDSVGKTGTAYKFTVKNDSAKAVNYTISLEDQAVDGTKLSDSVLNAYLTTNNDTEVVKDVTLISDLGSRVLTTGVLNQSSSKDFALRIWIDDAATDSDVWDKSTGTAVGKVFSAKVKVQATQVAEYAVSVVNGSQIKSTTVYYGGNAVISGLTLSSESPTVTCQNKNGGSVAGVLDASNSTLTVNGITDHITCTINY